MNVFTAENPIRIYCPFVTQSARPCLSVRGGAAIWCANGLLAAAGLRLLRSN